MNLRNITRTFTRGALGAVLAAGLVPTAALAAPQDGRTDGSSPALEAFAQKISDRIDKAIATGSEEALYEVGDTYNHVDGDANAAPREALPARFDLRDKGVVTPVKLQNPWGTCWGFASIAAAETSILSELGTTYDATGLDLSERHLAWFAYTALPLDDKTYPSQAGEGHYPLDGTQSGTMNLGSSMAATSVFSSGIGPLYESNVPYHGVDPETGEPTVVTTSTGEPAYYSADDDWSVDESMRFATAFELEESLVLPSPAQTNANNEYVYDEQATQAIKENVLKGDAVSINFHADASTPGDIADPDNQYINPETWAHYTYEPVASNHLVTIVGWDDDYPKENFVEGHEPPEDGAWIVKNSWGAFDQQFPNRNDWGVDEDGDGKGDGYFYLSYYDQSLNLPETFNFDTDGIVDHSPFYSIDQYDLMPSGGALDITSQATMKAANVFTVDRGSSLLRSLSCETSKPNSQVTFDVYLLNDDAETPDDGRLLLSEQASYEYGGYHRLQLNEPVLLPEGSRYAVVVTEVAPDGVYTMPIDTNTTREGAELFASIGLPITRYSVGVVNPGESFIYSDGSWSDWSEAKTAVGEMAAPGMPDIVAVDNFPIKAYLDPAPVHYSDVSESDWFYDAVEFAAFAGLMKGYGGEAAGTFGPNDSMLREDAAVVLYRALAPEEQAATSDPSVYATVADETGLADVADGQYYTPAVNWAYKNGYLTGYGDGEYGVGDAISREQFSTVLWRAAGSEEGNPTTLEEFSDGADVSSFAREALAWLVQNGVVQGTNGEIQPQRDVTRAEIAAMLLRMYQL